MVLSFLFVGLIRSIGRRRLSAAALSAACCLIVALLGCSKAELKQALEDAKTKTKTLTESTVQAIEENLPELGRLTLDSTAFTEDVDRLNLELISVGDGRPNVVQIATYDVARPGRQFPAVLFHGTTAAGSAASLVGETIQCDVYLQTSPNEPVTMTRPGSSIPITFDSLSEDGTTLHASLGAAELLSSNDQTITIRGGQMIAVIEDASP